MFPNRNWDKTPLYGDKNKAKFLKYDRLIGIEFEASPHNTKLFVAPPGCGGGLDPSTDLELQTPPLSADMAECYIEAICDEYQDVGYDLTTSDGLHIHLDGKGFSDNQTNLMRLVNTYYALEPIIYSTLPRARRDNRFCRPITSILSSGTLKAMFRTQSRKDIYYIHKAWYKNEKPELISADKHGSTTGRYIGFNLHPLLKNGHLELRYHSGTVNKDKVMNWCWLNLHMLDWVQNGYRKSVVRKLLETKDFTEKVKVAFEGFEIPKKLQRYIGYRQNRFSNGNIYEAHDDGSYSDALLI